ncbi:DUF736 domain-containing protein [Allorhizobium undicola]|uniref:DUF736 domain-containing protein n=1 Tax=Allorhizobium undicola TaxID=78527 RepID=UPI0006854347
MKPEAVVTPSQMGGPFGRRSPHLRGPYSMPNHKLGAAWQKTSGEGRDYLSVKLDDPSFPAPIYATLAKVEGEEGLQLIWSRPNRD